VLLPESKDLNQLVIVKITNLLTLTEFVKNVHTNVLLVKPLLLIVLLVLISELQLTLVHVQQDIMNKLMRLNVMLVMLDVLNVKIKLIIVLSVLMKEYLLHQNVHVTMDITNMLIIVNLVVGPVLLVQVLN